ncbi:MAG TPA: hypothetical protein VM870_09520 [Pyrinomonadaceae bacterium]|jgi:DNA-directed RNA polymerase subunit M/transcription elongation factor TFIIS|nr:hypothetical protein [Pyrinomonadaceae bacterium]
MKHFFNTGYGWTCRRCHEADRNRTASSRARFMREGEAEEREPRLDSSAQAKWVDPATHAALRCPRCGTQEAVAT